MRGGEWFGGVEWRGGRLVLLFEGIPKGVVFLGKGKGERTNRGSGEWPCTTRTMPWHSQHEEA